MAGESPSTQRERYSRHLLLPHVGAAGQEQLTEARVLIVGAGGLGAPVLTYLAAAGVGTLGIIDDDHVELSNLQRQVIHSTDDVGRRKVDSAAEFVAGLNPNTNIVSFDQRLTIDNVFDVLKQFDVIVDGTDNFPTRYLLNDACVAVEKPYVWAAIFQFTAALTIFHGGHGPCYRCIYPTAPPPGSVPSCAEGGVLGALPGLVGTTQALETIKLIMDVGTPLRGRLATYDGLAGTWDYIPVKASPQCPSCSPGNYLTQNDVEKQWRVPTSSMIEKEATLMHNTELLPQDLHDFLSKPGARLIDVRTDFERDIVSIPEAEHIEMETALTQGVGGEKVTPLVIMCRSGVRSDQVATHLRAAGYEEVYNLTGGILKWVKDVAPDQPVY